MRLRGLAREPRAPARNLTAPTGASRTIGATTGGQRQITSGRAPAVGGQQGREAEYRTASASEQHWHLHLHGTSDEQLARVLGQAPGRTPRTRTQSRVPRDAGGHHDA